MFQSGESRTENTEEQCFNSADNVSVWANKTREHRERERETSRERERDKQRGELTEGVAQIKSRGE